MPARIPASLRWAAVSVTVAVAGLVAAGARQTEIDPRIERLVAAVSRERLEQLLTRLVGFGTRETLSTTSSPTRGIGAAREWMAAELRRSHPKLQVAFETFQLAAQARVTRPTELRNVIAILPGRTSRRVYITGHYDTVSLGAGGQAALGTAGGANPQARPDFDHDADAPGANDNGSGTALTMELARVLSESGIEFDATLVFALWAGEEQGLYGSAAHAQRLATGTVDVEAVLNNDIVGNSRGGNGVADAESVRVYALGPEDSMSRSLARYVDRVAALYLPGHRVRPMAREDRFSRGSDHSSFIAAGFPAVVFREANENFARQHSAADTIDGIDFAYLAANARVNAAAAASLALAPPAPRVTGQNGQPTIGRGPSGYDAALRWQASPGAVGYRIYWRDTWASSWERSRTTGPATEFIIPGVSIDDVVFGVAAIGAGGHESLVRAWTAPPRAPTTVTIAPGPRVPQ